ncbi:phosphoglucosamine mutase [Zobellella endophytica]|uniref:Phosphoglucosamine mutase n=1 Tax=Zobellella endophytica TaxID=2116700 RepID=A0A2P7R7D2_9GAMM|nr:phosphoglucosamine mutase [Zobellella endophytica]PSJ46136.1 phosphoglucosamine mutase [Zobellella endophytica]
MSRKYFGTDGVRGRVGEAPITPEFVMKLGWAAGKVLSGTGTKKVLIGKDTRISGYMLESALEAGLSAAGLQAALLGPMPTPAIAYLTRTFRAEAGIVISASHNPYYDNGIKFFSHDGTKLPDEVELAIEALLEQPMDCVPSDQLGKASRINDAAGRYIEFCKSTFPSEMHLDGLTIVLDCAHGATYHIAPAVFEELGARVIRTGVQPNGLNINDEVGSTAPQALIEAVLAHQADLGIAFDGDGDRLAMVDHTGALVDGDQILYVMARDAARRGTLHGGVVGTLMSNMALELALAKRDIPFVRASVGDRYVMEKLKEHGWKLGGENSGHIISLDHNTTGDGIVAALQVLRAMVGEGVSLQALCRELTLFPQVLVNVRFQPGSDPLSSGEVRRRVAAAELALSGQGRVLLRKSGTEPLIRVMVEGADRALVEQLARHIAEAV